MAIHQSPRGTQNAPALASRHTGVTNAGTPDAQHRPSTLCHDWPQVASARLIFDFVRRGRTYSYGNGSDRSQRADLYLPGESGRRPGHVPGPHPVIVLIHGGSWTARYGRTVMRGLAGDLRRRGWAVWNIEYRRVGNGGGWPATFLDVAAAIDHLPELDAPLDLARVTVVGHSAGGHLALWAAGRE